MHSRRTLLTTSATSAAALLTASPALAKTKRKPKKKQPARRPLELTALIGGVMVSRPEVLQWEARRLTLAARRLRNHMPDAAGELNALILRSEASIAHVAKDRETLADAKVAGGRAAMRQVCADDLLVSGPAGEAAAASGGYAISTIDFTSNLGTAKGFSNWFLNAIGSDRAMLRACPDHWVLDKTGAAGQHVIEVTGGAVLATEFSIDYNGRQPDNQITPDPKLPTRLAGFAIDPNGVTIGMLRHQFGDRPGGGFYGRPAIGFPASLPSTFITEHRWHLACEFSNWVEAYIKDAKLG